MSEIVELFTHFNGKYSNVRKEDGDSVSARIVGQERILLSAAIEGLGIVVWSLVRAVL